MSVSIGRVAYIATWDATSLTKGMLSAQQMFREQKKITQAMQSPLEKYVNGLTNLQKISEKYPDIARHRHQLEQQLELVYLKEAKAVRVLTDEETRRLKALSTPGGKSTVDAEKEAERLRKAAADREALRSKQLAAAYKAAAYAKQLQDKEVKDLRDAERKRVEAKYAGHKAEKDLDARRQKEEEENVRRARKALEKRLHDRKQYGIRMREQMRNDMRTMQQDELAGFRASAGPGSGFAPAAGALGLFGKAGLAGAAMATPAIGVKAMNRLNNSDIVNANRDLERTESALTVFSGSLAESARMIAQMRDLSSQTGVSFGAFTRGTRTMLQFGMAANTVLPAMRQVAIVTGGNSERMESLSLAIAQANAAGKLMGQELIQMVNAGWSPAEEIMKRMNWDMVEFRKQMELGAISSQMVADALQAATEQGGRFYGFLEELEGTSAREFDKMSAAWEKANADIGAAIEPVTALWNSVLTKAAEDFSNFAVSITKTVVVEEEKIDRRLAAREEKRKRVQMERERVAAVFARQEKEREEQRQFGLDAVPQLNMEVLRQSGTIKDEDLAKFDRYISLMSEFDKTRATIDFTENRNLGVILGYLDKEVQAEVKRLEVLEDQLAAETKRKEMLEKYQELADRVSGKDDPIVESLAELEVARKLGMLSQEAFEKAQRQAVAGAGGNVPSTTLASSINANSQEAYQFIVGAQDRQAKEQMKKIQEQVILQQKSLKAQERANELLDEIADNAVGAA